MAEKEFRQDGENSQSGRDGYKSYNREGYNKYGRGEKSNSYGRRPYNNNREGEKVIVLLIILALIMERTVRREVVTVIARSVHTETAPTIMKEESSVLLTILVSTTIMVDVRSVHTLLVSTTTRKEENSVHIARALIMHNRVENSVRIVLVLTTMADSRVDMVVHREVTVRVLPTTTRMQNIV